MTTQADELREAVAKCIDPHANWNGLSFDDSQFQWQRQEALRKSASSIMIVALYLRANARSLAQHDDTAEAWVEKIIGLIEEAGR